MIHRWARQTGLQAADAEDLTQNVLVKMATHLQSFRYDPQKSFRGWLHTVTKNALSDYFAAAKRRADPGLGGSVALSQVHELAAREDLLERLNHVFDLEVATEAFSRVRLRVAPKRWQAYEMTTVEGLSGSEVATRLGMPVATVYTAKSQVQQMVRDEIAYLESGGNSDTIAASE